MTFSNDENLIFRIRQTNRVEEEPEMNEDIFEDVQVLEELKDIKKNIQKRKEASKMSAMPMNHLNMLEKRGHQEFEDDTSSDGSGRLIRRRLYFRFRLRSDLLASIFNRS